MLKIFLTICFIATKFSVLACLIIWMHKNKFVFFKLILKIALLIFYFFSQEFCVVYLKFAGYQMKA